MKKQRLLFLVQDVLLTLFVVSLVFGFSVNAAGNSRFDVNGDGVTSIQDVTALLIYLADPGADDARYDVNQDRVVSIQDVTALLIELANPSSEPDDPIHTHTEGDWITDREPTCTAKGSKHTTCTECGETVNTEQIPALGHTESDWITDSEPGCTVYGSKHIACLTCGQTLKTGRIPAPGHTESDWMIDIEPTCTGEGSRHTVCFTCGQTLKTEILPKLGHDYVDSVCSRCGNTVDYSVGLEYTLNYDKQNYVVSGIGTCTDTDIVIPSHHPEDGKEITRIITNAFKDCTSITSVTIPDSITMIGENSPSGYTDYYWLRK